MAIQKITYPDKNSGFVDSFDSGNVNQIKSVVNANADQFVDVSNARRVATVADLKAFTFKTVQTDKANFPIQLLGYYEAGDGGGGLFYVDTNDTTTAEDEGMVFVTNGGLRIKRLPTKVIDIKYYGAKGDYDGSTGTDNTSKVGNWIDYLVTNNSIGRVSKGDYYVPALYKNIVGNLHIIGEGRDVSRLIGGTRIDIEGSLTCKDITLKDFDRGFNGKITEVTGKSYDFNFDVQGCRFINTQRPLNFDLSEITWLPFVWQDGRLTLNANIKNNVFQDSEDIMISCRGLYDTVYIKYNTFKNISISGAGQLVVTTGEAKYTRGVKHTEINGNTFENILTEATEEGSERGWCILTYADNCIINHNTLKDFQVSGIRTNGVKVTIRDNFLYASDGFTGSGYYGIGHKANYNITDVVESYGVGIYNNVININLDSHGIFSNAGARCIGNRIYSSMQEPVEINAKRKPEPQISQYPIASPYDPNIEFNNFDLEFSYNYIQSCPGVIINTYNVRSLLVKNNTIKRDRISPLSNNTLRVGIGENLPEGVIGEISNNHLYDMDISGETSQNMTRICKNTIFRDNFIYYNSYSLCLIDSEKIYGNTFIPLNDGVIARGGINLVISTNTDIEIKNNKVSVPAPLPVTVAFDIRGITGDVNIEDNEIVFGDTVSSGKPFLVKDAGSLNKLVYRGNKITNESGGVNTLYIDMTTGATANIVIAEHNICEGEIRSLITYNENVNHLIAKNNIIPFDSAQGVVNSGVNTPLFTNINTDNITLNQVV